ncbi:MAG: pyruvate, water dikinase regulatory protein [Candidatus Eisenbacteria bacterium]
MVRTKIPRLHIFVVSDATGSTAEAVARSALVQFAGPRPIVRRFGFVRTEEQVNEIVEAAPEGRGIIVFTLVSAELASRLKRKGRAKSLTVVDVLSPVMKTLGDAIHKEPRREPGTFRHEEEESYKIAEAIHYTLRHDDGQGLDTLDEADLIILGVSRTGKTPTSIYLSCRKLKVANIPIVHGISLPEEVFELPVKKVGFKMNLDRLVELRERRVDRLPITAVPGYHGRAGIFEEIEYCEGIYRKLPGLRTIDVTNRSIEETAEWIVRNVL